MINKLQKNHVNNNLWYLNLCVYICIFVCASKFTLIWSYFADLFAQLSTNVCALALNSSLSDLVHYARQGLQQLKQ